MSPSSARHRHLHLTLTRIRFQFIHLLEVTASSKNAGPFFAQFTHRAEIECASAAHADCFSHTKIIVVIKERKLKEKFM